jgi:hypothetical protein
MPTPQRLYAAPLRGNVCSWSEQAGGGLPAADASKPVDVFFVNYLRITHKLMQIFD